MAVAERLRAELEEFMLGDRLSDLPTFGEFLEHFPVKYRCGAVVTEI